MISLATTQISFFTSLRLCGWFSSVCVFPPCLLLFTIYFKHQRFMSKMYCHVVCVDTLIFCGHVYFSNSCDYSSFIIFYMFMSKYQHLAIQWPPPILYHLFLFVSIHQFHCDPVKISSFFHFSCSHVVIDHFYPLRVKITHFSSLSISPYFV